MPDNINNIINNIGLLLIDNDWYKLYDAMLYSDVEEGVAGVDIFRNLPDCVLYMNDPFSNHFTEIGRELCALWRREPPEKRWSRIAFVVRDGAFEAAFVYPDEIDRRINPDGDPDIDMNIARGEDYVRQREEAVRHYFGDKPIVYPPPTPPSEGQLFEL